MVVVVPLLAFALVHGSAVASASGAAAQVSPHVVALARALVAHRPAASALPIGFRETGCGLRGLRDHAIPCVAHISAYPDRVDVIYYMLEGKVVQQDEVTLNYRIYATHSAALTAFEEWRHRRQDFGSPVRNARPTAGLEPYPGFLSDEGAFLLAPGSSLYKHCIKPTVGRTCWTTRAWALVDNVVVSANAGLGAHTGNAAKAIKLAKVGVQHLREVQRSIK